MRKEKCVLSLYVHFSISISIKIKIKKSILYSKALGFLSGFHLYMVAADKKSIKDGFVCHLISVCPLGISEFCFIHAKLRNVPGIALHWTRTLVMTNLQL